MSNKIKSYSGLTTDKPIFVDGVITPNPDLVIGRKPFFLERYEFSIIIKDESIFLTIGQALMGASIALFVNMMAKFIGSQIDEKIIFDLWEVYAFGISLLLMIISFTTNKCRSSEKETYVNKINEHFKNS